MLELGCGDGENLVPMAYGLPESEFVGVDLSRRAIDQAREFARGVGAGNVTLHAGDLCAIDASWGDFDYVIAHGLYSWVPEPVRARVLEICRDRLTPNGVAYISYDTLPGGHLRQITRDMLRFHGRAAATDRARIDAARELLPLLANAGDGKSGYSYALRDEIETLLRRADGALLHDDLCDAHLSLYFHEFIARACAHGLQYLAEAEMVAMNEALLPAALRNQLDTRGASRLEREQYGDLARGRKFRASLLCRARHALAPAAQPSALRDLHPAAFVSCEADEAALLSDAPVPFRILSGNAEIWHPIAKLALVELGREWPCNLATPELLARARARRGFAQGEDEHVLCESLLALYAADLIELRTEPLPVANEVGARPRLSAVVRWQAARGEYVTTLAHERVRIEGAETREVLAKMGAQADPALAEGAVGNDEELRSRIAGLCAMRMVLR